MEPSSSFPLSYPLTYKGKSFDLQTYLKGWAAAQVKARNLTVKPYTDSKNESKEETLKEVIGQCAVWCALWKPVLYPLFGKAWEDCPWPRSELGNPIYKEGMAILNRLTSDPFTPWNRRAILCQAMWEAKKVGLTPFAFPLTSLSTSLQREERPIRILKSSALPTQSVREWLEGLGDDMDEWEGALETLKTFCDHLSGLAKAQWSKCDRLFDCWVMSNGFPCVGPYKGDVKWDLGLFKCKGLEDELSLKEKLIQEVKEDFPWLRFEKD